MIWNRTMEKAGRAEMQELQLTRLRQTVERAYHGVPSYRAKMKEKGVRPDDIRTLGNISKLPFTTKQDMRNAYPYGLLAVPMKQVVRVHCSSGTTGKPTVVAYTRHDLGVWAEVLARTLVAGGLSDTSVFQVAVNYGLFTGGLGFHYAAELVGASVVPISGGNTARQVMLMKDFGTTAMIITPSYSLHLAETMREIGVKPEDTALESIFCGAETWSDRMHDQVEETYGVKAFDVYGLSEIIGPGVACECSAHDGLHIQEDHFYTEIVDPVSGEVLPDGVKGEVVITTLTKEGMPMIRYRTRDLSALRRERCACGRTQTRMERVLGRSDDMLIIRGANIFPSQVEDVLLGLGGTAPHYQLLVERESNLDTLTVLVEKAGGLVDGPADAVQFAERKIQERLKAATGLSPRVRMVPPKTIERSEGKAKRVIDKRAM